MGSSRAQHRAAREGAAGMAASAVLLAGMLPTAPIMAQSSFVAFESGQVRPLAMSADGNRLFATNTPDNRLEIYDITDTGLVHRHSVPVGLEPVAVAAAGPNAAWVVNHLSDSVSIVSLATDPPEVVRTLQVGDEPRDIVFAGPGGRRAFITTAHRGQNSPLPYQPFRTEGRADVWIFDLDDPGAAPTIIPLFGDTPRPLAVSPDGNRVYVGIHHSGNRTSVIPATTVGGDNLPPFANVEGAPAPDVGLIVRNTGSGWRDAKNRRWDNKVRITLPDFDVFVLNAAADPPLQLGRISTVGTTLFNMVTNPVSGSLYVSNTEARNHIRFEGPGVLSGGETVRGHFVENRITVVRAGAQQPVAPRHLNKHIDYDSFPGTAAERAASLATPTDMVVSADGRTLYLAAFGSGKVARFDTAELESDTFVPNPAAHATLAGGGPSGLVLDEVRGRLYVLTRFNNAIATVDLASFREIDSTAMFNPEPESLIAGRPFLYDARRTSSRGDSSCAGCHIFGDVDHLAWNLGNPDGVVEPNPNPPTPNNPPTLPFHPMKGPTTTQTLKGIDTHGAMHWRGDRTGGNDPESGDPFDERAAFKAFNVAFEGLLGRTSPLTDAQMEAFTDFALQLTLPPNPIRALDDSLSEEQQLGRDIFFNRIGRQGLACNECHTLDPAQGLFGSSGLSGSDGAQLNQSMKVPQLRTLYTKVGFFGRAELRDNVPPTGPQIRGFGYIVDGSFDSLPRFLLSFQETFADGEEGDREREAVASFLLAFDSNLAPTVGQQVTLNASDYDVERFLLLLERTRAGDCDLVGKGVISGRPRGLVLVPPGQTFQTDRAAETISVRSVLNLSRQSDVNMTYSCVPPGSGIRIGIDRDEDGVYDGDET